MVNDTYHCFFCATMSYMELIEFIFRCCLIVEISIVTNYNSVLSQPDA